MLDDIWPLLDKASPTEIHEFNKGCVWLALRATNLQRTRLGDLADSPSEKGGADIAERMEAAFDEAAYGLREGGEIFFEEYLMTYRMARAAGAVAILCDPDVMKFSRRDVAIETLKALDNDPTEIVKLAKEILHA